jgi:phosphoglycolate phosphatase-like HAD superfamily hydrolase
MHNKKYLIFDFDGTIADSLDLLVKVYNSVCYKYNCLPVDISDKEELRKLKSQEILKRYKINFFKIPFLLLEVRLKFRKKVSEVKIFTGIGDVLKELKNKGFILHILTSNSKKNVNFFLKDNNLSDIFTSVYSNSNVFGKDKSLKKFLKKENINKEECVYIGDETRDIEAVKRIDMSIVSVSWGFNSRDALTKLEPYKVIESPKELLNLYL